MIEDSDEDVQTLLADYNREARKVDDKVELLTREVTGKNNSTSSSSSFVNLLRQSASSDESSARRSYLAFTLAALGIGVILAVRYTVYPDVDTPVYLPVAVSIGVLTVVFAMNYQQRHKVTTIVQFLTTFVLLGGAAGAIIGEANSKRK